MTSWPVQALGLAVGLVMASAGAVAAQSSTGGALASLSLEDLMNLDVTSVSRREQPLSQAAAAVYVVSREDIRRSGVTTLPEALRLVPGLQVARIDGNKWAISARGFNSRFANKMLVLLDGRSVYTPLFSGVFWDLQDTMLEDVARIEVIRGPGGTLWGANAVNGVINVITRDAADTQGGIVTGTFDTVDRAVTAVRYGGRLGSHAHYRVHGQFSDRAPFTLASGATATDATDRLQMGARVDWTPSTRDSLLFTGDVFSGEAGQLVSPGGSQSLTDGLISDPTRTAGANVLGRWTRTMSPRSQMDLQMYVDMVRRNDAIFWHEQRNVDVDFQHHLSRDRHQLVWGLGYRRGSDLSRNSPYLSFATPSLTVNLASAFVQDEFSLVRDRLRVTLGTKLEHNTFTQWEVQPSARVAWTLSPRQTLWASSSRAVRTPSRVEHDVRINLAPVPSPGPLPIQPALFGTESFLAETLLAHELGYRWMPTPTVTFDLAAFHNSYDNLRTAEPGQPFTEVGPTGPRLVSPLYLSNLRTGTAQGVELLANWTPFARWRTSASYTYIDVAVRALPQSFTPPGSDDEDDSPKHQVRAQSYLTLARNVELDMTYYGVSRLIGHRVPAYHRIDARLGWQPNQAVRLSVGARNLGTGRHREFGSTLGETPTYMPRSVYAQCAWHF
ncbi:MAG TPA: TonB-dependent receptor [Luteitalea sp.]|nr:TonB-dependent receptor [Luteitalea sp.]